VLGIERLREAEHDPVPIARVAQVGRRPALQCIDVGGHRGPLGIRAEPNAIIYAARWSPDGTRILFKRPIGDGDNTDLFTMRADGTDVVRVTNNPDDDRFFDWGTHPLD
jgi:hypothetical protein